MQTELELARRRAELVVRLAECPGPGDLKLLLDVEEQQRQLAIAARRELERNQILLEEQARRAREAREQDVLAERQRHEVAFASAAAERHKACGALETIIGELCVALSVAINAAQAMDTAAGRLGRPVGHAHQTGQRVTERLLHRVAGTVPALRGHCPAPGRDPGDLTEGG